MELLKPRTWSASDISLLKAGSTLFGIALGMSLPKRCKAYAPLLLLGVAALAVRPVLHYFRQPDATDLNFRHDYEPDSAVDGDERTPAGENL